MFIVLTPCVVRWMSHNTVCCVMCDCFLFIGALQRKMSLCSPGQNLHTPCKSNGKKIRKSLSSFMSKFGKFHALQIFMADEFAACGSIVG
jgi:hypothetical protein